MVIEDSERGDGDDEDEDWRRAQPDTVSRGDFGEGTIGAAAHERSRIGLRRGNESALMGEARVFGEERGVEE